MSIGMQYCYYQISLYVVSLFNVQKDLYTIMARVVKRLSYLVECDPITILCIPGNLCRLPIQTMCLDAHEYSFPINAHRVVINYIQEKKFSAYLFANVVWISCTENSNKVTGFVFLYPYFDTNVLLSLSRIFLW